MLKKFLKEVVVIVVGKQAEEIVDLLDTKKHINEFVLAKKLDITINQTRNILYKISDHGLVSSIRKKDKRKGWYTYFWKIEVLKSLEFLRANLNKKIDQFNHQIKSRETKRFYICERCAIEVSEENALLYNFTCNECGAVFSIKDNTKLIKDLKKHLERLKKDLELVEQEIKNEREKVEKKKSKELRKEERIVKEKRAAKRKKVKKKNASRTHERRYVTREGIRHRGYAREDTHRIKKKIIKKFKPMKKFKKTTTQRSKRTIKHKKLRKKFKLKKKSRSKKKRRF